MVSRKLWSRPIVDRMLHNPMYLGNLVQLKTTTVSHKNHKLVKKDEAEWSLFRTHMKRSSRRRYGIGAGRSTRNILSEGGLRQAIPDEYKEWLGLTASLTIDDCDFSLYMPEEAGENEEGFRMIAVGSVSAREYFINADSGKMFVYDDLMQKTEEFDSLDDMITDMYARIEMYADEDFGDEWQDAYDEMFPEE